MSAAEVSAATAQTLEVHRAGNRVPAVYWTPATAQGLVLVGHGGSQHKLSEPVVALARGCVAAGLAALAIDGPVHGERRPGGDLEPSAALRDFGTVWRSGAARESMVQDWKAALEALQSLGDVAGLPVGYFGLSMGAAYGMPLVAAEPRIAAAVLGLWGANHPASEHLLDAASRIRCPVSFVQKWNDEIFDRPGTHALFDAIASTDKRLVAYPGGHPGFSAEQVHEAVDFLRRRLLAQAPAPAG